METIMKEQNANDWKEVNINTKNYKIPLHWLFVKFTDYINLRHGYQFRDYDFIKNVGGIKVIKISQLSSNGKLNLNDCSHIDTKRASSFKDITIENGDVLMALTGATLGKTILVKKNNDEILLQNYRVGNFIPLNNNLNKIFLYYLLQSNYVVEQIFGRINQGAQPNVGKSDFDLMYFFYPPLQEQEKIAEILSNIDDQIEMTQEIITKTEEIKQGLMQELLIKGIGHKEFKEVELNDELYSFPKSWNLLKLKNCCSDFLVPMRNKPKIFEGSIPWCRIEDFNGKYLYTTKSNQFVTPEIVSEMKLKIFPKGTVICSCSATLGICSIAGNELVTNQTFIGIVTNQNDLNNEYLYYLLQFFAKRLQKLSTGTTIAYLPRKKFEDLEIVIPNIDEQNKIVQILSNADEQIINEENYLQKLQEIKKGLMQDLLSGKVRVKIN